MWNVRLYYHTHLNTVNTLDRAALLETADYLDVPALDILQAEGMQSITVKATRAQVKNVEYVKLTDTESGDYFYYEAGIPQASSLDVQVIPILIDGVLTMGEMYGGVQNIPFLDGIITRHHVAKANDEYGAYTEEDPLLIPSKELDMDIVKLFDDSDDEMNVVVESTIALDTQANHYQAHVYTDTSTGNEVTVPTVVSVPQNSTAIFGDRASMMTYETAGTEYFDGNNQTVQKGISAVRGLGIESGILNSYVLPSSQADMKPGKTGQILTIQGVRDTEDSTLDFEYANVDNKRVLYGALNAYELISVASGMSATFKPEDLKVGETGDAPTVLKLTDPRPNGRPYFMFKFFKGSETESTLKNAVAGMEWANAPLVYTGKSGSTLDQINFKTAQRIMNLAQGEAEYQNGMGPYRALAGLAGQAGGMALGSLGGSSNGNMQLLHAIQAVDTSNLNQRNAIRNMYLAQNGDKWFREQMGQAFDKATIDRFHANETMNYLMNNPSSPSGAGMSGIVGGVGNLAMSAVDYFHNKKQLESMYGARMSAEMAQFATGQITAPALNFPRSETLRDFIGNGVFVVRYKPQTSDIQKLDKILTMYGYKDTMPLVGGESVFNNRSKFNFVQVQGCSIGGDAPRWLREATAAQLSAGVRIWHVIPTRTAYNAGENV